jgi:hypothetical protein
MIRASESVLPHRIEQGVDRRPTAPMGCCGRRYGPIWAACLALLIGGSSNASQTLLEGEFGDIELGRELIGASRFPTIGELREAVRDPQIRSVLMLRLCGDEEHHYHVPVWSPDGERLALQHSKPGTNVSRLLQFMTLSQAEPQRVSQEADGYEYMFRWGVNSESGFVFARIQASGGATQICYGKDGAMVEIRTPRSGQYFHPSLYERTDGIRWLAFEHNGEVHQQAWDDDSQEEQTVARGSEPRWSSDGRRLLMTRRRGDGPTAGYDVVVHHLRNRTSTTISVAQGIVRSPAWAPDEQAVAFFVRGLQEGDPWEIQASRLDQDPVPRAVLADVVVNPDYKSEGPSWEPGGRRVWGFSHRHRQQEYYPFVAAEIGSGRTILVDYPRQCTNPNDLALNPRTEVPEIAFVGQDGSTRDVFIVLLNRYEPR